jgi:hypothetical protein
MKSSELLCVHRLNHGEGRRLTPTQSTRPTERTAKESRPGFYLPTNELAVVYRESTQSLMCICKSHPILI